MERTELRIAAGDGEVSAVLDAPPEPRAGLVLAHGAGAGMRQAFLAEAARGLAARGIATLRYQFPYMEKGGGRPDPPARAQATVRAAVAEAARRLPGLKLLAGGKSFGGRMTSQAEAEAHLDGVGALVFFGFPLHPPGKPGIERAAHLAAIRIPMLFLQGTRDEFAELDLLRPVAEKLPTAALHLVEGGDHSFKLPARSGRKPAEVMAELLDAVAALAGRLG